MMLQTYGESLNGGSHAGERATARSADPTKLPVDGINLKAHVEQIELSLIRQALERSHGVVANAARMLGLRRTTLVEKMRKYRAQNHRFDND